MVTTGGLKALSKTGATEISSDKADKSSTGGGTTPIPHKVCGSSAGGLSAEEDKSESVKVSEVKVKEKGADSSSFIDAAAVDKPVFDVNV